MPVTCAAQDSDGCSAGSCSVRWNSRCDDSTASRARGDQSATARAVGRVAAMEATPSRSVQRDAIATAHAEVSTRVLAHTSPTSRPTTLGRQRFGQLAGRRRWPPRSNGILAACGPRSPRSSTDSAGVSIRSSASRSARVVADVSMICATRSSSVTSSPAHETPVEAWRRQRAGRSPRRPPRSNRSSDPLVRALSRREVRANRVRSW